MPSSTTPEKRFEAVVKTLSRQRKVTRGSRGKKGFGSSAPQVGGKIFAMVSSTGHFVVKLPKTRVEALEAAGVGRRFDPGHGRLMKEWLALEASSDQDWLSLAREALGFVGGKH